MKIKNRIVLMTTGSIFILLSLLSVIVYIQVSKNSVAEVKSLSQEIAKAKAGEIANIVKAIEMEVENIAKNQNVTKMDISSSHEVVVLEGNIVNQKIISKMLSKNGVTNIITKNPKEAVEVIKKYKPGTLFLDNSIKESDVNSTIDVIKEIAKECNIVVMIKPGDESECYRSDEIIVKPVKEEDMMRFISGE